MKSEIRGYGCRSLLPPLPTPLRQPPPPLPAPRLPPYLQRTQMKCHFVWQLTSVKRQNYWTQFLLIITNSPNLILFQIKATDRNAYHKKINLILDLLIHIFTIRITRLMARTSLLFSDNNNNHNKNIFKAQLILSLETILSARARAHTHTHRGTHTHKHSDYTKQKTPGRHGVYLISNREQVCSRQWPLQPCPPPPTPSTYTHTYTHSPTSP